MNQLSIAYVDVIDACHLKCPTCVRGVRVLKNSGGKMPLDQFERIAIKLRQEGYSSIGFFSWTEPFLNRNLQDYVAVAKAHGFPCLLSSTLAFRHIDNLEETLVAGVDTLFVSMSGMTDDVYAINHVNGDITYTLANLERAAEIKTRRGLSVRIVMKFLRFPHNAHQVESARSAAGRIGIDFEVHEGGGNPYDPAAQLALNDASFQEVMSKSDRSKGPEAAGKICGLMFDIIAIDYRGEVHLCCAMPTVPAFHIGPYLELSEDEILRRRYGHLYCPSCKAPRRDATASDKHRLERAAINS